MNLRLRLVAALVVLLTLGFAVFGVTTYAFYSRAQYERLDEELAELSRPVGLGLLKWLSVTGPLDPRGGFDDVPDSADGSPGGHGDLPGPSSYVAQLRDAATGEVVGESLEPVDTDDRPDLPAELPFDGEDRWLTVGSVDGGSTDWRVLVTPVFEVDDRQVRIDEEPAYLVVVAAPTTGVQSSLGRLAAIELVVASTLLVLLAVGAWFVLRRGLRPLEQMASTAGTITAGGLATRVAPADDRSEVGQLGLALNTMLGRLEGAFAEQEATEQRLRRFLADVSHELRTPLTSIQGFAELFRLGAGQDEADREVTLRRIEEESARMRQLVDDLLLLARLDQTRPLERRSVDLAVVAADACTDAVAVDPARTVTLDAPSPVVVAGDDAHLRQAVSNLVTNALRHTPAGTAIDVAVARDDAAGATGEAVVTVRDHGPGLDDDALVHAFDRFWQADASRAEAGAGLGLSIVAAVAAEHGGRVSAANAGDGPGAVFTLRLPAS